MNYIKLYETLTSSDSIADYTEIHHILPKCMGGTNEKDNLVRLTAREHYLAHRLLTKIYPNNVRLLHAFSMMGVNRTLSSKQYEKCKEARSLAMSIDNPMHKVDDDTKKRMYDNLKSYNLGDKNIMRRSKELREFHSERMKRNNPLVRNPEKTNTAKPVIVEYTDGKIEHYPYAKRFAEVKGISYNTVKYIMRKRKGSKKHMIKSITQVEKG